MSASHCGKQGRWSILRDGKFAKVKILILKTCSDWLWRWSKVFVRIHFKKCLSVIFILESWIVSTTGLPVVLGKMEWMSNSYLQCQQGTLNVFICGTYVWKLEGGTWIGCLTQEVSVEVSRRIVMEKALIFYPMYWLWKLKMWCEGESSCYQGSGYNVQLQIEWSHATPDIECRDRSDSI